MKAQGFLLNKLFIMCNESKKQFAKLIHEWSVLMIHTAKFGPLGQPIRPVHHVLNIGHTVVSCVG